MEQKSICAKSVSKVIGLELVDSTQTLATELIKNNEPNGTLILACQQTNAINKNGKVFFSPEGGVYFSLITKSNKKLESAKTLEEKTAKSIALIFNTIFELPTKASSNEVFVSTENKVWKKIAGVRVDSVLQNNENHFIVGVGIYLNNPIPKSYQKTHVSLSEIIGSETSKELFLTELLDLFWKEYYYWENSL